MTITSNEIDKKAINDFISMNFCCLRMKNTMRTDESYAGVTQHTEEVEAWEKEKTWENKSDKTCFLLSFSTELCKAKEKKSSAC